jgi:hypothetical protein
MSCLLTLSIAFGMLLLVESIGRFHTKFKMMTFGAKMMEDLPAKHVWRSPLFGAHLCYMCYASLLVVKAINVLATQEQKLFKQIQP